MSLLVNECNRALEELKSRDHVEKATYYRIRRELNSGVPHRVRVAAEEVGNFLLVYQYPWGHEILAAASLLPAPPPVRENEKLDWGIGPGKYISLRTPEDFELFGIRPRIVPFG